MTHDTFRHPPDGIPIIVCFGGGVDSTAMLVAMKNQGIRPDAVTFADIGSEKPETYEHVKIVSAWLEEWAGIPVTTCTKATLPTTPYTTLTGNCVDNQTLPSLAFGMKSCSMRWKKSIASYHLL